MGDDRAIWQSVDGYTWAFTGAAGAMIVVGGLVAAINSAAPFAHGSWLAAYLVLVGGVAQLLLGVGSLGLPAPRLSARLRRAQLGLWNGGNAAVAGACSVTLSAWSWPAASCCWEHSSDLPSAQAPHLHARAVA